MRKRIISTLMALCMALTLLPVQVLAAGAAYTTGADTAVQALTAAPTGTELTQSSISGYFSEKYGVAWYNLENDTYYLSEDVTLTAELCIKETVTLDLNGHVLDLNGNSIYVYQRANLTLQDSSPNAVHKFDKTNAPWTPAADDAAGESIVEVRGGIIAGGKGYEDGAEILGGGVYVSPYSTFTMNGGSIVGCSADNGGGVYVENSTFTMNGGSIVGCTAASYSGGGVYVTGRYGAFSMNGGSIADCTAAMDGGGVYATTTTTISGSITGCSADCGGGVYATSVSPTTLNGSITGCTAASYGGGVYTTQSLVMEDGSIADCTAAKAGGGVYVEKKYYGNDPSFTMNGGTIMNCTAGGVSNAVHADGPFTSNGGSADPVTGRSLSSYGEAANPILIDSAKDLKDFRDRVNNGKTTLCARLTNDIVLNDGTFDENGNWSDGENPDEWTPIGWYKTDSDQATYAGTFDGGGHTIKGLYINRDESGIGLFRIVSNATIKNLTVTGYVKGYGSVGGIVGEILEEGNATIQNCANYCEVTGDTYVGGIVGYIGYDTKGDIRNCANFGTVKGTCTDSSAYAGGIVGYASIGQKMTVVCTACYNVGTVKAKKCAGGLLGEGSMKMDSCYNVGLVEGEELIGGLVGSAVWLIIDGNGMSLVTVDNCYYLDTATKAFGEARFFTEDTSAWCKSKTQFANELLPLLQNGDENSPWTKTGYLAAAGMTLPLLSWQTADAHTCEPEDPARWESDESGHWQVCSCGLSVNQAAHSGTDDGNCTTEVSCDKCGYVIELAKAGHDWTGWRHETTTHTRKCQNPGCSVTETKDCTGGTTTCTEQATCEVCGGEYGALAAHRFTAENTDAKYLKTAATCTAAAVYYKSCAVCGEVGTDTFTSGGPKSHSWGAWTSNGNGTHTRRCGADGCTGTETANCSGGTATCTARAVCGVCGQPYGAVDAANHDLKRTAAKEPGAFVPGRIEYWQCRRCGKYFADANGAKEISRNDTVIPRLGTTPDSEGGKTSPATFDAGIGISAVTALTSLAGLALLRRRRRGGQ